MAKYLKKIQSQFIQNPMKRINCIFFQIDENEKCILSYFYYLTFTLQFKTGPLQKYKNKIHNFVTRSIFTQSLAIIIKYIVNNTLDLIKENCFDYC